MPCRAVPCCATGCFESSDIGALGPVRTVGSQGLAGGSRSSDDHEFAPAEQHLAAGQAESHLRGAGGQPRAQACRAGWPGSAQLLNLPTRATVSSPGAPSCSSAWQNSQVHAGLPPPRQAPAFCSKGRTGACLSTRCQSCSPDMSPLSKVRDKRSCPKLCHRPSRSHAHRSAGPLPAPSCHPTKTLKAHLTMLLAPHMVPLGEPKPPKCSAHHYLSSSGSRAGCLPAGWPPQGPPVRPGQLQAWGQW